MIRGISRFAGTTINGPFMLIVSVSARVSALTPVPSCALADAPDVCVRKSVGVRTEATDDSGELGYENGAKQNGFSGDNL